MGATTIDGPEFVYGNLGNIEGGLLTTEAAPDPNSDAAPSVFFQGIGVPDPRILFLKDKIQGWTGMAQAFKAMEMLESARTIPIAHNASGIAAAVVFTSGTAVTMPTTNVLGFNVNVPMRVFSPVVNAGAVTTAAVALDYGFGYASATNASTTFVAGNIWDYFVGMPVCISDTAGHSAASLLTIITGINTASAQFITANAFAGTTGVVAVGTGDLWGPNEASPSTGGYPTPLAHAPFLGVGPGLFLDARQALMRGLAIAGTGAGATGGTVLISGADAYGAPQTQLLTVGAGTSGGYTLKTFKYIYSIVPQFTDTVSYNVGTSDLFGFAFRTTQFEDTDIIFEGVANTGNSTLANSGWVSAVLTQPSTNLLGDVRGTFQSSTVGPGTGWSSAVASNGTLSANLLTGHFLSLKQSVSLAQMAQATQQNPYYLMGVTPV